MGISGDLRVDKLPEKWMDHLASEMTSWVAGTAYLVLAWYNYNMVNVSVEAAK